MSDNSKALNLGDKKISDLIDDINMLFLFIVSSIFNLLSEFFFQLTFLNFIHKAWCDDVCIQFLEGDGGIKFGIAGFEAAIASHHILKRFQHILIELQ